MASSPAEPTGLHFDPRNTTARETRARYAYQDECLAVRCVANLVSEGVWAVVVEWSADYLTLLAGGGIEVVSVKHRDPGQSQWPLSKLKPVLADLHMIWRAMAERPACVFESNVTTSKDAGKHLTPAGLARHLGVGVAEAERFGTALRMPDGWLPHRNVITATGIRDMGGALSLLGRDPAYAEPCYRALVARIAAVAIDEPPTPEQRIQRLTGDMRAVIERSRPSLGDQLLRLADLRALVLAVHDRCVADTPPGITVRAPAAPPAAPSPATHWQGGETVRIGDGAFLVHDPVEVRTSHDRRQLFQQARARQLAPAARDVWLRQFRSAGAPTDHTSTTRPQQEADLYRTIPALPTLLDCAEAPDAVTLVIALPATRTVTDVFAPGAGPCPGFALDQLLRGLSGLSGPLTALHRRGLAHRMLHPDALLVAGGGRILLRDAGLAAAAPSPGEGPSAYRAPEQERPLLTPPGPATDAYQIAALVHHLATGSPPGTAPTPPSLLRPDLTAAVDGPVLAALDPDPARRPTVQALIGALARIGRTGCQEING